MKIEDAIKQLQAAKNRGTKSIIFAYWEADMFEREDDWAWESDAETVEDRMDWSYAHDQMSSIIEENN